MVPMVSMDDAIDTNIANRFVTNGATCRIAIGADCANDYSFAVMVTKAPLVSMNCTNGAIDAIIVNESIANGATDRITISAK